MREGIIKTTVMQNGRYNCEIVVMSEVGSKKLYSEELFEEIVALLHCYSMKLYSKRKISKIKEIISEEESYLV